MTAFNKGFYLFIFLSMVNGAFAQNRLILPGIGLIELNADSVRLINTSADIALTTDIESYSLAFESNGELLFYSNNEQVFDRNGTLMSNGDLMIYAQSTTQGSAIFKSSYRNDIYYIVTLEAMNSRDTTDSGERIEYSQGRLFLSTIDMSKNNGLGAITSKNQLLYNNLTEKLSVTRHPCGGYWVVVHERYNDQFISLYINDGTVQDTVISAVGFAHEEKQWTGEIKFSPDGKKLAVMKRTSAELFSFNPFTGEISDQRVIFHNSYKTCNNCNYYSCEFSKSGDILYMIRDTIYSVFTRVLQKVDMTSSDAIIVNMGLASEDHNFISKVFRLNGDHLYVTQNNQQPYISMVEQGDSFENSNYKFYGVSLGKIIWGGAGPIFAIENDVPIQKLLPLDTTLCLGDHITIDLSAYSGHDWSDGSREAIRRIDSAGTYMVSIETDQGCLVQDSIKISYTDERDILSDTIICSGGELLLRLPEGLVGMWDDGSMSDRYMVTSSGAYSVSYISSAGCLIEDTAMVSIVTPIDVHLGSDIILCPGETVALRPEGSYSTYQWNTGSEDSLIGVSAAGEYILSVYDSMGCEARDTVMVVLASDCNCEVYIPNAISLDSSLGNDTFRAVSNCTLSDYQMDIYDRWGGLLYRSLSPEYAWDGTTSGQQVNSGVYLYRLSYRYPDAPQSEYRTGSIMVYR